MEPGSPSSPCLGGATPGWASSAAKVVGAVAGIEVDPAVGADEEIVPPEAAAVTSAAARPGSPREL